ncbi:MAG TPA: hypothetical protein VFQ06_10125, partial [Nitrospira sp.]|nr:hypothetical protein [Nitrospira sp.]
MAAFYPSFDVILIDTNGKRVPLGQATVDAYNTTASASEGTVVSDDYGAVAEGSFTADAGDVVRFTLSGYTGFLDLTLQTTQSLAYTAVENAGNALIVENQYATTNDSEIADVYITDNNDPTIPPQKIGSVKAGETSVIPYAPTAQKSLQLHLVSKSVKGQQSATDFARTETYNITVPAPAGVKFEALADEWQDRPTTGTTRETLFRYSMPTGVLDHEGDKLIGEYVGVFTSNGNNKRIYLSFGGTDLFDSGNISGPPTDWRLQFTIIRAANTTVRSSVMFASSSAASPVYTQVTGLDLNANSYDIELDAHTSVAAGEATGKMGHITLFPRMPQTSFGALLNPLRLEFVPGTINAQQSRAELGGLQLEFVLGDFTHYVFPS